MEKLRGLIFILVIAGGVYYGWNMIPPYFHNSQFQDDLDDIVRKATYTNVSEDDLKAAVIRKAADSIEVRLKEDQITVSRGTTGVSITVKYRVHVDMIVHPVDLDFIASSHNKIIGT
jgi:hypothetical protein